MTDKDAGAESPLIPQPTRADPATVFSALAEILYSGSDATEVYAAICVAATLLVPGCDHASLMLHQRGQYVTVAATDDLAAHIDTLERRLGQGPCMDAITENVPQIDPDLRTASHWPELARAVVETTSVRGVMGFRLTINQHKVGALNLFSTTAGAFTTESAAQASVLTAFASVTATAISRDQDIASLRAGLLSNREIGTAVGLLMGLEKMTADEAFDLLRRTSQQMNLKVADLARSMLERHDRARTP